MNRERMIREIEEAPDKWDVIIVGGGATGLGSALDSASRGYKTLLLEQSDFAKGTSSRSTKLIHGGLRYLQQGNIALVTEALKERGLLCENAPHLIHHLPFLVPSYHWWEGPFYGIGMKIYDVLAGKLGIEKSRSLSREETLKAIPTLEPKDLRGGVVYYDGQFDDSRLAICLAQSAADQGATLLNYVKVTGLIKKNGVCCGVHAKDMESGVKYQLHAHVVINATGVFSDNLIQKDDPKSKEIIAPSQGIHLVLDKSFQPGGTAILVPHTSDKRVLFMVPWHDRILVGTTDTPVKKSSLEPRPLKHEIDFLLTHAGKYLTKTPSYKDILSIFAGLRPLVKTGKKGNTAALSRDHVIFVSKSGLVSIAGGKWTTYRKMAEDVISKASVVGKLPPRNCLTESLKLHGWQLGLQPQHHFSTYGTFGKEIKSLAKTKKGWGAHLHPCLPYSIAEVIWAVREEMARTVEDVLSRRTRSLLLDAHASIEIAPKIAKLMAKELNKRKNGNTPKSKNTLSLGDIIYMGRRIYLIRHSETAWTLSQRHTGLTDIPLTKKGEEDASLIGKRLKNHPFEAIFCSPLQRAAATCEKAGLLKLAKLDPDLVEWNYGDYEGLTTAEIREKSPHWNIFSNGAPGGESVADISNRASKVLKKIHSFQGDVALFSHGHFLRALAAQWLGLSTQEGRLFALSPASLSILGFERANPVICLWNDLSHS